MCVNVRILFSQNVLCKVGWALAAHAFHVCSKAANRAGNECLSYGNWCFFPRRQPETRGHKCPPYEERHGAYQFLCVNDGDFAFAERSLQSRVGTCCPRVPHLPEDGKPSGQRVPTLNWCFLPPKGSLKRVDINAHQAAVVQAHDPKGSLNAWA